MCLTGHFRRSAQYDYDHQYDSSPESGTSEEIREHRAKKAKDKKEWMEAAKAKEKQEKKEKMVIEREKRQRQRVQRVSFPNLCTLDPTDSSVYQPA